MRSAAASSSGRLGFRFILIIILLCICSATGAVSKGQPHRDDGSVSVVSAAAAMESESEGNFFLETNTLYHQLHKVVETITERAHRMRNDSQSLQDQIADAVAHLRSIVVDSPEQPLSSSSSSSEMAAQQQAELHAGLAAMRAAVDAGMARVEASYRSLGDAVDRLREMRRQLDDDVDGQANGDEIQHALDDLIRIHNSQSVSIREAQEELRAMHANISAALDRVLMLVQYSRSYNITR